MARTFTLAGLGALLMGLVLFLTASDDHAYLCKEEHSTECKERRIAAFPENGMVLCYQAAYTFCHRDHGLGRTASYTCVPQRGKGYAVDFECAREAIHRRVRHMDVSSSVAYGVYP